MTYVKEQTLQQRQVLLLVLVGILVVCVVVISISLLVIYPPRGDEGEYTSPKNVLFIVVDDLRPALGCYGDKRSITPNIDFLASKSIIFKNAFAQQALCAPSRTSFLTSRRPDSLCLYDTGSYWRDVVGNYVTIPQHFKKHGYETISVGKVFHHGIVSNKTDDYPYSWSKYPFRPPTIKYKMKPVCPSSDGEHHMNLICPVDIADQPEGTLPDIESTEYAIQYLKNKSRSSDKDVPFFLGVGYYKPHIPFKFPKEFLDLYPIEDMDLAPNHTLPENFKNVSWNPWTDIRERDDVKLLNVSDLDHFPFGPLPEDFQKLARQGYYASLSYMDDQLGMLLEALQESGFAEQTAIVLLGDHGWSLGEHQEWSKYSNFEVSVKVPLIVYVPGLTDKGGNHFKHIPVLSLISKNETFLSESLNISLTDSHPQYVSEELVELVDIFPTLAEIANLPVPPLCRLYPSILCSEGLSFYSVIKHHVSHSKADFSWKTGVFSQYPRPSENIQYNSDQPKLEDIKIMGYSVRTDRFRYTEWVAFNNTECVPKWKNVVAKELYDHKEDPYEALNVYDVDIYSNTVKELSKKIRRGWRHALPPHLFGNLYSHLTLE